MLTSLQMQRRSSDYLLELKDKDQINPPKTSLEKYQGEISPCPF